MRYWKRTLGPGLLVLNVWGSMRPIERPPPSLWSPHPPIRRDQLLANPHTSISPCRSKHNGANAYDRILPAFPSVHGYPNISPPPPPGLSCVPLPRTGSSGARWAWTPAWIGCVGAPPHRPPRMAATNPTPTTGIALGWSLVRHEWRPLRQGVWPACHRPVPFPRLP